MHPTDQQLLDRSFAIGIVSLPIVVVGFLVLAIAGWVCDCREGR